MKALITGGAGFIGSALTRHVVGELGWQALVIDKLTYAGHVSSLAPIAAAPGYAFLRADICDADALGRAFSSFAPDIVFHLAAESHVDRSIDDPVTSVRTNTLGTVTLLDAARRYWSALPAAQKDHFRFIHVSTDEVHGALGPDGVFTEASAYDPRSPYAAGKAGADHLTRAFRHTYGLPTLVTTSCNNFGPYQTPEKLIPLAILAALNGEPVPIYGDGLQVRDWLHVADHARALVRVAEAGAPGETYAIGARCERANLDLVTQICTLLDARAPKNHAHAQLIAHVEDRPGHDRRYAVDPSKLEAELGWAPAHTFQDGLAATVQWYLDNAAWWAPLRAQGHGLARLGRGGA